MVPSPTSGGEPFHFRMASWRTVGVEPAVFGAWPESAFYGYNQLYTVPAAESKALYLPGGLFLNGWIHVLEDSELAFLLMLEESIALRAGRDPISNSVRAGVRRFPRITYALAIVIGMLIGHEFWP